MLRARVLFNKYELFEPPCFNVDPDITAEEFKLLEDIEEVLTRLQEKLSAPLLYGGSVKVENIESILNVKACEGVLVGTASWNEKAFCEMIRIADTVKK
jgi:triosephosphate isomerase